MVVEPKKEKKKLNLWLLALPSSFDIIETSFKNVTLVLISASVTQMLRSSVVVFTAFLALIFLKKILYRHHYSSLSAIILGIFLVGLSSILSGKTGRYGTSVEGIVILLVGQLFGAGGYVIEEKFLGDFEDFDPFLMAGLEGLWCLALWIVLLPILNVIPCGNPELCVNGVIEDSLGAFRDY